MFNKCCSRTNNVPYSLKHNPKPIIVLPKIWDVIHRLLWYTPGIDSFQSEDNYLLDDPLYSIPIFEHIIEFMGLDINNDLKLIDEPDIPDSLFAEFNEVVCTNCQKIILTKRKNETWIKSLLRHVRNSIAHGRFTLIHDLALFVDKLKNHTALLKINFEKFNEALLILDSFAGISKSKTRGQYEEKIFKRVFEKNGFEVLSEFKISDLRADFVAIKDNKKYAVEIKYGNYRPIGSNYEKIEILEEMFGKYHDEGYIPMLIFDRGWLTPKAAERLKEKPYIVFDKRNLADFFSHNNSMKL